MITVDKEQEMCVDHGELWIDEEDAGFPTVITFMVAEDNELNIGFTNREGQNLNLYLPLERVKALLND